MIPMESTTNKNAAASRKSPRNVGVGSSASEREPVGDELPSAIGFVAIAALLGSDIRTWLWIFCQRKLGWRWHPGWPSARAKLSWETGSDSRQLSSLGRIE